MTKHSEKGVGVPTIYFINATSPAKNHALQLFESDLQQSNVHVGCVAESWFNDKISTNYTDINGFSLFRRDRKKRKGGSVCILCSKQFSVL